MRTSLLLAIALPSLAFAGCVGGGNPPSAMDAAADMDAHAASWSSDAALIGIFGLEQSSLNSTVGTDGGAFAELYNSTDAKVGDGHTASWGAGYYSESKQQILPVIWTKAGVHNETAIAVPGFDMMPAGMMAAMAKARDNWTTDSPAAIRAVRAANATIEAALTESATTTITYGLAFYTGAWEVSGQAGKVHFSAEVDFASAAVTNLNVTVGLVLPPNGGGIFGGSVQHGPLPAPIHETGTTSASADPLNFAGMPPCSSPTSQCTEIPFTLNETLTIDATLTWGQVANDFDFYILDQSGTAVLTGASPVGTTPGPPEHVTGDLEAGTYTVQIVPWSAAQDSWTFDATFAYSQA